MGFINRHLESVKNNVAWSLAKVGVPADVLSFAGLLAALASGVLLYKGRWTAGAAFLLGSGVLDLLDGAVARQSGKKSFFGGVLDSSLDRYGDSFIFGGILFYFAGQRHLAHALLAFSALVGAYLISYVRARAESEIEDCRVGFWERGERLGCLLVGLWLGNLTAALWFLALGSQWTAFQRLLRARGRTAAALDRGRPAYYFKAALIVGALLFLRLPLSP